MKEHPIQLRFRFRDRICGAFKTQLLGLFDHAGG